MSNRMVLHGALVVIAVGGLLYVAQNCGVDEPLNNRSNVSEQEPATPDTGDQVADTGFEDIELSLNLFQEDIQVNPAGLQLVASPGINGFKAQLICSGKPNLEVTTSPIVVSANASCVVALSELTFAGTEGTYKNLSPITAANSAAGAKHLFQSAAGEQLIVLVASQIQIQNKKATASFQFFQVKRNQVVVRGDVKEILVQGELAPDYAAVAGDVGTSNAGVVLRVDFNCTADFSAAPADNFKCGSFTAQELKLINENFVDTLNLNQLEADSPSAIDGPDGLVAKLGNVAAPLIAFAPVPTAKGFSVNLLLPDVASGRFGGLPKQVLVGVATNGGGVASTLVDLQIN
jgi:hypothetical protein